MNNPYVNKPVLGNLKTGNKPIVGFNASTPTKKPVVPVSKPIPDKPRVDMTIYENLKNDISILGKTITQLDINLNILRNQTNKNDEMITNALKIVADRVAYLEEHPHEEYDNTYIGSIAPNPDEYNKWINTDGHSEEGTSIVIDEPTMSTYNLRRTTVETTETIVIDEETKEAITVYEASEGISVIGINENVSDKEIIIIEE